jgi:MtrB/PioB family decaheme-associated outer membrane protein
MRTRLTIPTAALLLASANLALAQATPQTQTTTPAAVSPVTGTIDFGVRGTTTNGDEARYERYRDLRSGANMNLQLGREGASYAFDAMARNIGYRDGLYAASFQNNRAKFAFRFDQLPLNYAYYTRTPWVVTTSGETAVLALDQSARLAVQNRQAGVVGIPTSATQLLTASIYRALASPFDLQQRRDTIGANAVFSLRPDLDLSFDLASFKRTGSMPWGASFAFNNANEVPLPLDNRTTEIGTGIEWANQKGMVRVGYEGSFFHNSIHALVWDNPVRATDWNTTAGTGYDPSAYSNGNGAARGQMSLPPSNRLNRVIGLAMIKLPYRSTLNGTLSLTSLTQNEQLLGFTSNAVIAPLMPPLERETAEADVRYTNAAVNFTSRPTRILGLQARYRYTNRDDRTPIWEVSHPADGIFDNVRFDGVPEDVGGETEHLNIRRQQFDANASFNVVKYTQFRVGYGHDNWNRTGRGFSDMADNIFRVSVDTVGNQYLTVRGQYELNVRKGSGFSEAAIEEGGAQPGLRFYDESDRDRHRGTVIFEVNPISVVGLNFSVAAGKDEYKGEGHEFGLLDNTNTTVTIGVDVMPRDEVAFGLSYGRDRFSSLQASRNANPPADLNATPPVNPSDYGSWFDPNRTWTLDHDEHVNNVTVYLDLVKALPKTDIRFAYDFSDSDQAFVHGGPRIEELRLNLALSGPSAIVYPRNLVTGALFTIPSPCSGGVPSCFEALPNVTNTWHRATVDVRYFLTPKFGVGVGYWFEKFDVKDFATINLPDQGTGLDQQPRIDYLGGLVTGYGNRPYRAHTAFARVIYLF